MSFWQRLFQQESSRESEPNVRFGRYSDAYKTVAQYDAWDEALELFNREKYDSYLHPFFRYLNDDQENNIKVSSEKDGLQFELLQGSKKVSGYATPEKFKALTKVARTSELQTGFMRRILEENFTMKFSRYALNEDDDIVLVFDSSILDASPYKLYHALKEMATSADKQDDLLLDEFDALHPIDSGHIGHLPEKEIQAKYSFVQRSIQKVLSRLEENRDKLDQYPGASAYLFLALIYKLDYLVKPEGYLMEILEKQHRNYFAKDGKSTREKISALKKTFSRVQERSEEALAREFYYASSTFGITDPVNHDRVIEFIDGEVGNMDWYQKNQMDYVALAIAQYICGYCLFNFAVPKPDRDYFHFFYRITEHEYFKALGFPGNYIKSDGKLAASAIKRTIRKISRENQDQFPELKPDTRGLQFGNLVDFSRSYLEMVRALDMTNAF